MAPYLGAFIEVDHELIGFSLSIHTCFCALNWQCKGVDDNERIILDFAIQHAHNLQVPSRLGVHGHLQQCQSRDANTADKNVIYEMQSITPATLAVCVQVLRCAMALHRFWMGVIETCDLRRTV